MGNIINYQENIETEKLMIELSSLISLIGSLFIMSCFLIITRLQSAYNRLIFALGVANFLYSSCNSHLAYFLTWFKSDSSSDLICKIQGLLMVYSFTASSLIVLLISFSLYQIFINESFVVDSNIYKFLSICFALPLVSSGVFIWKDSISQSKLWCYLDIDKNYIEATLLVHGVYLISTILMSYFYIRIIFQLQKKFLISHQEEYQKVYKRIRWYPILLIVSFGPIICIRQIMHFGVFVPHGFIDVAGVLASLNGFFNAIFYALNEKNRIAIRHFFCGGKDAEQSLLESEGNIDKNRE
jgi:hypothetical protein